MYHCNNLLVLLSVILLTVKVHGRAVFAHYMVGTVTEQHTHQDINDAIAMNLDGFALNIGDPTAAYVRPTLDYLFGFAAYRGFKLFISMDLWAAAASQKTLFDYRDLLRGYIGRDAYYRGPNGMPFISTFGDGGLNADDYVRWRNEFGNNMYFVPNLDRTQGYASSHPAWFDHWGRVIEGVFGWESAWPYSDTSGGQYPGDVRSDVQVASGLTARGKSYMMPLSALQYKNAYGTNYYRSGELNLPIRMENILKMSPAPDFIQLLTWNDGPESHYIGTLWPEHNQDPLPSRYATENSASHAAWRPLVRSFIGAYKAGQGPDKMSPSSGVASGALWYKTILRSTVCSGTSFHDKKAEGYDSAPDQLNWAFVASSAARSYTVRVTSNCKVIYGGAVYVGLNRGSASRVEAGAQMLELLNERGTVVFSASGGRCITSRCPQGFYNLNPQVVELKSVSSGANCASCTA